MVLKCNGNTVLQEKAYNMENTFYTTALDEAQSERSLCLIAARELLESFAGAYERYFAAKSTS